MDTLTAIVKHWVLPIFLGTITTLFTVNSCWAADAVVLNLKGKVVVAGRDQTRPVYSGQVLQTGEQLQSRGGTARIIFADGTVHTLDVGEKFQITCQGDTSQADGVASRIVRSFGELAHNRSETTRKAMVRGILRIQVVRPCNTAILPDEKKFIWHPCARLQTLELVLKPDSGTKILSFRVDPESGTFTIPAGKMKLRPGVKYFWKLSGLDKDKKRYDSQTCWLTTLSCEQVDALEKDLKLIREIKDICPRDRDFLAAGLYLDHKLYDHVIALLTPYGNDPGIRAVLDNVTEIKDRKFL